MIDLKKERVFPLSRASREAQDVLPIGGNPSLATWHRWERPGLRGVRLETVRCGRTVCTSREAIIRFFAALSEAPPPAQLPPTFVDSATADETLDAAGIR